MLFENRYMQWLSHYFHSHKENKTQVPWYWEPFHATGLTAISWVQTHLPKNDLEKTIQAYIANLSTVALPAPWIKKAQDVLDNQGHLIPLDPSWRILETLNLWDKADFFTLPITTLQTSLRSWEPLVSLPSWAKIEDLTPWEKLEFQESFEGLTKSQTTLEFQRIDGTQDIF